MKTFVLLITMLMGLSALAADTQVKAEKVFDGNALNCRNPEDLNNKGFLLEEVQVTDLNNGSLRLTFSRPFVICTKSGWQRATDEEFFNFTAQNSKKQTYQLQHIKPEFILTNANSNAHQIIALDGARATNVAIDVRAIDLIDENTKNDLNKDGQAKLKLDIFLRTQLMATSPTGETESWGYRAMGSFRLQIPIKN